LSKDSNGYKVSILSFKEGTIAPVYTLIEDGSRILSILKRNDDLYYMDETLALKRFKLRRREGRKTQLLWI